MVDNTHNDTSTWDVNVNLSRQKRKAIPHLRKPHKLWPLPISYTMDRTFNGDIFILHYRLPVVIIIGLYLNI